MSTIVRWYGHRVPGADTATFRPLSERFARDARHVWARSVVDGRVFRLASADAGSFAPIGDTAYGADARHHFFADPTFARFDDETDRASFEPLSERHARDARKVYSGYFDVDGIDPARAAVGPQGLLTDGERWWFGPHPLRELAPWADPARCRAVGVEHLCTDRGVLFLNGGWGLAKPVDGADPATLQPVGAPGCAMPVACGRGAGRWPMPTRRASAPRAAGSRSTANGPGISTRRWPAPTRRASAPSRRRAAASPGWR